MPTLTWVGKEKVIHHHREVPYRVLNKQYNYQAASSEQRAASSEQRAASSDGISSQLNSSRDLSNNLEIKRDANRIIHGDNLEALKSLLPEFEGQVDCIYIDPPYNTGNEGWAYNDAVNDPKIKKWIGQVVGPEGEDLNRHDKWLCMMYPRIKLLHRLLAKTGVIFVSLDENELCRMRLLLEEIFGESNFLAQIIIQSNKRGQTYKQIAKTHEYLICFGKSKDASLGELETGGDNLPEEDTFGKYSSRELRNRNPKFGRFNRPNLFYPIYANLGNPDPEGFFPVSIHEIPNSVPILPFNSEGIESCWRWGKEKLAKDNDLNNTKVMYAKQTRDGGWRVFEKYRKGSIKAKSIWFDTKYISEQGTTELTRIGLGEQFQFPKPVALIEDCISLATDDDALILDSFAGSGTTAHAVLKLNAQDKDMGNRRFILIETMDYAETITAERVRRVISGYGEGDKAVAGLGGSFDYYTVGERLLHDDGMLNPMVGLSAIRDYVAWTEGIPIGQCAPLVPIFTEGNVRSHYWLGEVHGLGLFFVWNDTKATTLDLSLLTELVAQPGRYLIYADQCALGEDFMRRHGIIYKKIPRDITRL